MKRRVTLCAFAIACLLAFSLGGCGNSSADSSSSTSSSAASSSTSTASSAESSTASSSESTSSATDDPADDPAESDPADENASITTKLGPSPAWVANLPQAADAEQLFIVGGYDTSTAWCSMHEKDADGTWQMVMTTPGFIGQEGLGKTEEGDALTPVGTFTFDRAFGIAPDPGCAMTYTQVTDDLYWSGDHREGMKYNQMVSINDLPGFDTTNSEHLIEYTREYQYCLNISFNRDCIPGNGSAIFLHCLGPKHTFTGGCVAIPEDQMRVVMQHVRPGCVVVIDTLSNLGGSM